jgi:hypothetical protein
LDPVRRDSQKKYLHDAAFTRELCAKHITLSIYLIAEMNCNTDLTLGALPSHLLEHFFALLKRLMETNQTAAHFERMVLKAVTTKAAMTEIDCVFQTEGKSSDSGAILSDADCSDDPTPFPASFREAEGLFAMLNWSLQSISTNVSSIQKTRGLPRGERKYRDQFCPADMLSPSPAFVLTIIAFPPSLFILIAPAPIASALRFRCWFKTSVVG